MQHKPMHDRQYTEASERAFIRGLGRFSVPSKRKPLARLTLLRRYRTTIGTRHWAFKPGYAQAQEVKDRLMELCIAEIQKEMA